jgi:hypothetical protein
MAKAHTDAKVGEVEAQIDKFADHFEKRFEDLSKQVANLKVWLAILAAGGSAAGTIVTQLLGGGG